MKAPIRLEAIEQRILLIRGQRVMLSTHLAELYSVETRVLNQAVKRNVSRFPEDFMFQLNRAEAEQLVSQNVIPHKKYFGGSLPYAFTEQGVAMLSSVLNSDRAIKVNIEIMRAFVRLRQMISSNRELAKRLDELERKYDAQFKVVFDAIRELMRPSEPEPPKKRIGFLVEEPHVPYDSSKGFKKRKK
jgi:ORF6N domain